MSLVASATSGLSSFFGRCTTVRGGVLRFSELSRSIADCSQKMLATTLKNLERSRLIRRVVYPEVPPRVEYSLTETGRSLIPVLATLIEWAERHFGEVTGAVS